MAKQTINIGSAENAGDGDRLRIAFDKINDNFTELYDRAVNTDAQTLTLNGNTLSISGGNSVSLNISPTGDLKGSVFADDSTLLVDAVNGSIPYSVLSGTPTIPSFDQDLNTTDNPQFNRVGLTLGEINVTQGNNFSAFVSPDGVASYSLSLDNTDGKLTVSGEVYGQFFSMRGGNASGIIGQLGYAGDIPLLYGVAGIYINTGDGEGGPIWEFSNTGDLTIPGDIRSESAISIEINLTDSTLRRWRFGEDGNLNLAGNLRFPDGAEIRESGDGELRLRGAAGKIAQLQGLNTDGFVDSAVKALYNDGVGSFVTINTNIDAGSPEYIWNFDYNGDFSAPGAITSDNDAGYQTIIDPDSITAVWNGTTIFTIDKGLGGGSINALAGKSFAITTDDNNNFWAFGTDGSLVIPGDIKSEGNINIDINLSDSTLRRWRFGEDGELTFPNGSTIATEEAGGSTLIIDGNGNYVDIRDSGTILIGYNSTGNVQIGNPEGGTLTEIISEKVKFLLQAVPVTSVGATGDVPGLIAFDQSYVYYCAGTYNGVSHIWKRLAWSGDTW